MTRILPFAVLATACSAPATLDGGTGGAGGAGGGTTAPSAVRRLGVGAIFGSFGVGRCLTIIDVDCQPTPECDVTPLPAGGAGDITLSGCVSPDVVFRVIDGVYSTDQTMNAISNDCVVSAPGAAIPAFTLSFSSPGGSSSVVSPDTGTSHSVSQPLTVAWTGSHAASHQTMVLKRRGAMPATTRCMFDGASRMRDVTSEQLRRVGPAPDIQICVDTSRITETLAGEWHISAEWSSVGSCKTVDLTGP